MTPILTVSIPAFTEALNGNAAPRDCYTTEEIAAILDAAWNALDVRGLGLDGLNYAAFGGAALCSVYVVGGDGGDGGEVDDAILARFRRCVESARFAWHEDERRDLDEARHRADIEAENAAGDTAMAESDRRIYAPEGACFDDEGATPCGGHDCDGE